MLEPFEASFEEDEEGPVTLKDNYPYFGDGTGRSEPITIRNIKIRSESEPIDPDDLSSMKSDDASSRRKTFYDQPRGTLEHTVGGRDTVDSVALQFGSTPSQLMRINHMSSRMIFPGQVIYVPDPTAKEPFCLSPTSPTSKKPAPFSKSLDIPTISQAQPKKKSDIPTISQAEPKPKASKRFGLRKTQSVREAKSSSWARKRKFLLRQGSDPRPGRVVREASKEEEEADSRQFLKVDVKYITDGEGVVSGTMLVTPNAIMFDPNVSDPLVIERGVGPYGVITQMDMVMGASMYHDISAMNDKLKQNSNDVTSCPVYVPEKNQIKKGLAKKDTKKDADPVKDIMATTNGEKTTGNQELRSETTLKTEQELGKTSEVKGQECDIVQTDKADSTADDAAKDHGNSGDVTNESMPLTSDEKSQETEDQSKNVDLPMDPGLPESRGGAPSGGDASPQESMDVEDSSSPATVVDNLSKTATAAIAESAESKDSVADQSLSTDQEKDSRRLSMQDSEVSGTESSLEHSGTDDAKNVTSDLKGQEVTTIAEEEGEKSEDEGVESDLDEEEEQDEERPLVGPADEKKPVLRDELVMQREMEGYSTLLNEDLPGSDSVEEKLAQTSDGDADSAQAKGQPSKEGTDDVQPSVVFSVAMETDTSSTTNANNTSAPQSDDQVKTQTSSSEQTSNDVTQTDQDGKPENSDEDGATVKQDFVDFSSGLFAHNLSYASLVPDITECVQESCDAKEELKAIQAEGIEIRKKSEDELSRDRSDSQKTEKTESGETEKSDAETNGGSRMRSATDGTAQKQMDYDKTNLEATSGEGKSPKVEFLPRPAQRYEDPPLYLCLRVSKPMQKTFSKDERARPTGKSRGKIPEYWFAIPRDKADNLYDFFLQWTPDIYGKDLEPSDVGFVVVDQEDSSLEVVEDFFDEPISKDWEIITKEEANRRRMTLLECEMNLPFPELKGSSELLEDIYIRKLGKQLPPRTEGYSWSLLYSTSIHGFSLTSLYRSMRTVDSPILLVVKDADNTIFGSLVSCGLKISDHYYGTGETFLFKFQEDDLECYKWTGENNFFVKGDKDSLAIGGGDGTFGLWLDGDLYHGRSRSCKTFANSILSQQEDFVIANIEAWNFVLP
ncbi:LOW QUALITY PROTEIN: oxidation resistance protein 1-like [Amphiura filiformis]|uniref:LOW QUALITY PROTEIN: oxidation resistance protein 1-like n=1 Tax=Amphiura filiformis TaxID=82378 RepID=UPI003B228D0B